MPGEIRCSIHIKAVPQKVWRAVESQEMIRQWLGSKVEFEPRLGGRVRLYGIDDEGRLITMGGEVITWEPNHKLQFTWEGIEPYRYNPTILTIELVADEGGTLVTLVHSDFESEELYLSFSEGWKNPQKTLAKIEEIALSAY